MTIRKLACQDREGFETTDEMVLGLDPAAHFAIQRAKKLRPDEFEAVRRQLIETMRRDAKQILDLQIFDKLMDIQTAETSKRHL